MLSLEAELDDADDAELTELTLEELTELTLDELIELELTELTLLELLLEELSNNSNTSPAFQLSALAVVVSPNPALFNPERAVSVALKTEESLRNPSKFDPSTSIRCSFPGE